MVIISKENAKKSDKSNIKTTKHKPTLYINYKIPISKIATNPNIIPSIPIKTY